MNIGVHVSFFVQMCAQEWYAEIPMVAEILSCSMKNCFSL